WRTCRRRCGRRSSATACPWRPPWPRGGGRESPASAMAALRRHHGGHLHPLGAARLDGHPPLRAERTGAADQSGVGLLAFQHRPEFVLPAPLRALRPDAPGGQYVGRDTEIAPRAVANALALAVAAHGLHEVGLQGLQVERFGLPEFGLKDVLLAAEPVVEVVVPRGDHLVDEGDALAERPLVDGPLGRDGLKVPTDGRRFLTAEGHALLVVTREGLAGGV